jgi:hypothetical protein
MSIRVSSPRSLAAEHAQFDAADLDGRMVGQAFLERAIRDPKVQATGKWLCLERPLVGVSAKKPWLWALFLS